MVVLLKTNAMKNKCVGGWVGGGGACDGPMKTRSWTNGRSQLLSTPPTPPPRPLRPLEAQQRRLCLAEGHGGRRIETSERAHEKGRLTGLGGWGVRVVVEVSDRFFFLKVKSARAGSRVGPKRRRGRSISLHLMRTRVRQFGHVLHSDREILSQRR